MPYAYMFRFTTSERLFSTDDTIDDDAGSEAAPAGITVFQGDAAENSRPTDPEAGCTVGAEVDVDGDTDVAGVPVGVARDGAAVLVDGRDAALDREGLLPAAAAAAD